ncbi:hypothetical protein V6N11_018679 [Hibiscus sabdariffa]|uniref:DUF4283 domain-containing protein n=1 Tax=Hibiscus sabdariffa TaxID=183260 RepID=A0ABR2QSY5_9ROSI
MGFDSLHSSERPASPTLLEDQPLVKKNKNDTGMDMNGDIAAIDADGEERRPEIVTIRDDVGGVLDKGAAILSQEDVIMNTEGKISSIQFSNRVHDQVDRNMRNAIVVRLLGRAIGFKMLWSRINALWKPVGDLQLIDLDNNYFLVRFSYAGDYSKVLTQGPWTIFGNYLTVQPWSRGFSTSEKHPSHVIIWVRLPCLSFR